MKIEQMSRQAADLIGRRMAEVAADLAREMGLSVKYAGGTYGETSCVTKLEFTVAGGATIHQERDRKFFRTCAALYGLSASDLDREFEHPRQGRMKIVGMTARGKNCIILKGADGKSFRASPEFVKHFIGKQAA
ncbi:MAG: hypothetical protein RJA36_1418 [Pseudomonadota bacterium]